jgi:transcriptional regulator with XRE-family HTH domain
MAKGFAERLAAAREERGMSSSDFARLLGVTPTAVWNWEKNGVTPRPEMLERIARALGVRVEHLLVGLAESVRAPTKKTVGEVVDQAQRDIAALTGLPFNRVRVKVEFGTE